VPRADIAEIIINREQGSQLVMEAGYQKLSLGITASGDSCV
jgi:hypothetical protein